MTTENPTIWRPQDGNGEWVASSSENLVDSSGVFLADSSGNLLADDDSIFNPVPGSIWTSNDGD